MTDTQPLQDLGVPVIRNIVNDNDSQDFYFTYHHSAGDSMTMMDPDSLDRNVVAIASLFYILADMETDFPRN